MSNAVSLDYTLFRALENGTVLDNKFTIKQAFGRAAGTYDRSAAFQRKVGCRLMTFHDDWKGKTVLDLGCGTGYFSQKIALLNASVIALDLSERMLDKARERCGSALSYVSGDAEVLPLKTNSVDIAFSSLALQWCQDLSVPLTELKRVVKPGGTILFSTLLDGSLCELKQAWKSVDSHQHVNTFLSTKQVNIAIAQTGFQTCHLDYKTIIESYSSAFALMKDLKGIGATHLEEKRKQGLISKNSLIQLEKAYRQFQRIDGIVPATYQVCFGSIIND